MRHEIYVFGSITRGEVTPTSDADILVVPLGGQNKGSYPESWSVYSLKTIESMHSEGRLFSWHLYLDSTCVYTPCSLPTIERLGKPEEYNSAIKDIIELRNLLSDSLGFLKNGTQSSIYEVGLVHTCLRDIAMSSSWHLLDRPTFSIDAPFKINPSLPLEREVYKKTMLARHSSTRGVSKNIDYDLLSQIIVSAPLVEWAEKVEEKVCELIF